LAAELESLTAPALLLLRGAAVVGDPFDARVAASVGGVADADRGPALDVLMAGDLVREADPGDGYRFRHWLLRDAVYAGSGPGWRADAHARALAQLRPWCTDPVRLAPHVVEVAEPGEPDAVRLLAGAAAAVLDTAPAQARRWAAAALALLTDRQDTRAELVGTVGTALVRTGCLGEGVDRLREALRLLPVDAAVRATMACRAAEAFRLTGDPVAARAVLRSEAGRVSVARPAGPPGRRAQRLLHVELAALECGEGNLGAAEYHLRALEVPDGPDRDEVAALAECAVLAWVRAVAGDLAAAHPAATRYADSVDTLSDTQTTRHLEHLGYAVEALRQVGLWERGWQLARRGVALAHRAGWRPVQAALSAEVACLDRLAGRLSSAVTAAAECVDLAETLGNPVLRCRGLTAGVLALLWRDRTPGAALRAAESAIADADHGGYARQAELAMAEVALALGRSSGLAERIVLAGGGPELSRWAVPARAWVYETLVRLALADGDQTAARTWTVRAEDVTAGYRLPCTGPAYLARAAVLLAEGDRTGAAQVAAQAAGAFDRAGFPLEQARGRLLVADASDRPAAAAAELRKVKEIAVRCGSGRLRRLAGTAQASVGARHRADQRNDPPDLTDPLAALSRREREVAEQLRAGLTNREIAERLYITERTVETHVKHILHKLDLPSRAAVAGLVRR
jgi:DNA-binding CsgD family transcriptional regulator